MEPKNDMQKQVVNVNNQSEQEVLTAQVQNALGPQASVVGVNYTGPEVGAELAQRGMLAMIVAVLAIMVYIALRFEIKFAVSAAIALAHDPIIILGIFSLFQLKFDLTALAAILAVIGYSLNDTVVVYDRIRENFRKMRKASVIEVVNRAINDTLSRTIMTSGLTFLVVTVLFVFGGPSIHYFSLALMIGVIVGTYSSIYVAGALAVLFGLNRQALIPAPKVVDDTP
jgi:preprotein translocase subunit SecF